MEQNIDENQLRELIRQAQQGDTEAFGKIYDSYFESVYRFVAFRLPEEQVEDVVADIFVKTWEKLHTYRVRKKIPFGAWIFRIARHTVVDTYRKHREHEQMPETIEDQDRYNRAESRVKQKHLMHTMRSAMDKLPSRYRDVLQLSYMAELPHSEVARVMRITEGSVRILKHRALKKLEQFLPHDVHEKM